MKFETLLYEVRGEVALVHLNRTERLNAYTNQMRIELVQTIQTVHYG